MKFFFVLLILSALGFAAQASDPSPTTVSTGYKNIYIPKGFDNNDTVQVAAEGVFPNSCYQIAPPVIKIDEQSKRITLDAQAYHYKGVCMQVVIPFQQVVDLGIIKTAGQYKIETSRGVSLGQVDVAEARSTEADDYFYAPVQRVTFEDGPNNRVALRIEFNHSCLQVGEVKIDRQENVVVMQPIAKLTQTSGCAIGYFPTVETVEIGPMNRGRYLLHVRSSGSQAFNQIITVEP